MILLNEKLEPVAALAIPPPGGETRGFASCEDPIVLANPMWAEVAAERHAARK